MGYALSPDIHCAFFGDRTVILDVGRDTYRLFGPPVGRVLQSRGDEPAALEVLARLHALGIVEPGSGGIRVPVVERPIRSALECEPNRRANVGFPAVTSALIRAIASLRYRGLAISLERMIRGKSHSIAVPDELIAIAQAYDRHRSRIPIHQICLPDSIALRNVLRSRKLDAMLIIGVRLDPFAAHCWLQSGDMVLNDSCDHVSSFTPILVQ